MPPEKNKLKKMLMIMMCIGLVGGTVILVWIFTSGGNEDIPPEISQKTGTGDGTTPAGFTGSPAAQSDTGAAEGPDNSSAGAAGENPVSANGRGASSEENIGNGSVILHSNINVYLLTAADNSPVLDVRVRAAITPVQLREKGPSTQAPTFMMSGTTGRSGHVSFTPHVGDNYNELWVRLHVDSGSFVQPANADSSFKMKNGTAKEQVIVLESGGGIEGKIEFVDEPGPPYPEIRLLCAVDAGGSIRINPELYNFVSDNGGNYRMRGLLPRSYFIFLDDNPGHELIGRPQSVLVEMDKTAKGPTLKVRRKPVFKGTAVDGSGTPLERTIIQIVMKHGWLIPAAAARTDNSGIFQVAMPAGASWADFRVTGYEPVRIDHDRLRLAVERDGDLGTVTFKKGAVVWGRVVSGKSGEPVNGVRVSAAYPGSDDKSWDWTKEFYRRMETVTGPVAPEYADSPDNRGGWFVIRNVKPGKAVLAAASALGRGTLPVELLHGDVSGPHQIELKVSEAVTGKLLWDETDKPAQGLKVAAYPVDDSGGGIDFATSTVPDTSGHMPHGAVSTVMSDNSGSFAFSGLPSGKYRLMSQIRKNGVPYRALSDLLNLESEGASASGIILRLKTLSKLRVNVTTPPDVKVESVNLLFPSGALAASASDGPPFVLEAVVNETDNNFIVIARGCEPARVPLDAPAEGTVEKDVLLEKSGNMPGLRVTFVYPEHAAARAGVKPWDRLITYDGKKLEDRGGLGQAIFEAVKNKKKKVPLVYERNGKQTTVEVAVGMLGVQVH